MFYRIKNNISLERTYIHCRKNGPSGSRSTLVRCQLDPSLNLLENSTIKGCKPYLFTPYAPKDSTLLLPWASWRSWIALQPFQETSLTSLSVRFAGKLPSLGIQWSSALSITSLHQIGFCIFSLPYQGNLLQTKYGGVNGKNYMLIDYSTLRSNFLSFNE